MIFLTVGNELSFDRLSKAIDQWCADNPGILVFGQIGEPGPDGYRPQKFEWKPFITPEEYQRKFKKAELIVAHAGMGSIITALTMNKPILIMPRRSKFREHRNDHQVATAQRFSERSGILVAEDETKVGLMLDYWITNPHDVTVEGAKPFAEQRLIDKIKNFIWS